MNSTSRMGQNNSQKLPKDMTDLAAAIANLPEEHKKVLDPIYQRVADSTATSTKNFVARSRGSLSATTGYEVPAFRPGSNATRAG